MSRRRTRWTLFVVLIFLVLILTIEQPEPQVPPPIDEREAISEAHQMLLPLVMKKTKSHLIGVEIEGGLWERVFQYYYRGDIIRASIHAAIIEEHGYGYFDRKVGDFEGPLYLTLKGGFSYMGDPPCKPIPLYYWETWVDDFAIPAIEYVGPERIKIIGLMNEPDSNAEEFWLHFGCWGVTFHDGIYFASFVNYVYPRLKHLYPFIEIVAGDFSNGQGAFMDGFSHTIDFYDAISFHGYNRCYWPIDNTQGRIDEFRDYFPDAKLYLSETSLLYDDISPCEDRQADYMRWLIYDMQGADMGIWYTLGCNSWRNSDLIYPCAPDNFYRKQAWWVYNDR